MPGTGSYVGTNVNANYIYNVGDALYELRDNTSQLIKPQDVRDSVWTLWNRLDDVQIIASQSLSSSSSVTYTNSRPTTKEVGGIALGTTFSGTYSVQQMFDLLLYPYTAPTLTLSASNTPRQFGSSTAVTLTWTVVKTSETITGITVDGTSVVANGGNQNGTKATTATHSLVPTAVQEIQTYTMSVVDSALKTTTKTATVTWQHKIYWGSIDLSSVGNPNLTTSPSSSATVGGYITDTMIRALTGAGVSPGNAFATSYSKTYTNINGAGKYLIFAHPTIFGSSPTFVVNNLPNTAFTKVKSYSFVNESGFSISYDVWVSNTAYNGAANIIIS
jgi:hypothetical protein